MSVKKKTPKKKKTTRRPTRRQESSSTFESVVRILNSPVVVSSVCAIVKELSAGRRR